MEIEEQLFLHKSLRCLRVRQGIVCSIPQISKHSFRTRGESKQGTNVADFLDWLCDWWVDSAREKETEDKLLVSLSRIG